MLFVRIVDGGYTINGIKKRRIYIYTPLSRKPEEYNYASIEIMKKFGFGSIYKNGHFILVQWEKHEILKQLEKVYGKDNFTYIFE
jgi:hypothetical protein